MKQLIERYAKNTIIVAAIFLAALYLFQIFSPIPDLDFITFSPPDIIFILLTISLVLYLSWRGVRRNRKSKGSALLDDNV